MVNPTGTPRNILIVEDDEFLTEALRILFENEGYLVHTASNGKMAIEVIQKVDIHCIVSDLQMPIMGGIELAKWIVKNKKIPFILMTGYVESINTLNAVELGAINMLYKPFSEIEMLNSLENVFNDAKKSSTMASDGSFIGFARIPQGALVASAIAAHNLYREADGKLLKIVSKGEPFYLKDMGFQVSKYIYTECTNLGEMVRANLMVAKAVSKSLTISTERKMKMLQKSLELINESFRCGHQLSTEEESDLVESLLRSASSLKVLDESGEYETLPYGENLILATVGSALARAGGLNSERCASVVTRSLFPQKFIATGDGESAMILKVAEAFCRLRKDMKTTAFQHLESATELDQQMVSALKQMIFTPLIQEVQNA